MKNFLNMVFIALCVNLLANIMWNQWPELAAKIQKRVPWTEKFINLILAFVLVVMCGAALLFTRDASHAGPRVKAPVGDGLTASALPNAGPLPGLRNVSGKTPFTSSTATGAPNKLTGIIRRQQMEYVGESSGSWASESFTKVEERLFKEEKRIDEIINSLKSDQEFLAVVAAMRSLASAERDEWLRQATLTYQRTWSELELDPDIHSREDLRGGQTEAGQNVQRIIADEIVGLVKMLL